MRKVMILATALMAASVMPARAAYVTATYSGVVTTVYDGATFSVGDPITASVTFDPAKLVDVTASVNAVIAGFGEPLMFQNVVSASLSDDANDSAYIKVGDDVFTKFDQVNYGSPDGAHSRNLGAGDFPLVYYLNGAFKGIGGTFVDASGTELFTDPVEAAVGDDDGHDFYIDDATSDAEGDYDFKDAIFTSAAPEPSMWLLMCAGISGIGVMLRRAKSSIRLKDAFST